jgi:hypothetical protein
MSILNLYKKLIVYYDEAGLEERILEVNNMKQLVENEQLTRYIQYEVNDWIFPFKWNQEVWDVVQVLCNGELGIRQITSAVTHINKFQHLQKLINDVQPINNRVEQPINNRVEFLTILMESNFPNFKQVNHNLPTNNNNIDLNLSIVWYKNISKMKEEMEYFKPETTYKKQKIVGENS